MPMGIGKVEKATFHSGKYGQMQDKNWWEKEGNENFKMIGKVFEYQKLEKQKKKKQLLKDKLN